MKIGYIRTSTIDQNLDRQKQIIKDNNIELLFSEQESGKDTNRPILNDSNFIFVYESDWKIIRKNIFRKRFKEHGNKKTNSASDKTA